MKKKIVHTILLIGISTASFAQNAIDAVRYSNIQTQGSARFEAMGGSFGATGADVSSNQINPAGYGRYSSSIFSLTGHYNQVKSASTFENNATRDQKGNFKLPNVSFVIAKDISRKNNGMLYNQFGFSYNRMENFTARKTYQGKLYKSLLDEFANYGQGIDPNYLPPFTTMLAWNTYAIDPNGNGGYVANLAANDTMFHSRTIHTKGGIGNYSFNYSFNYLNKLYFGTNLGISTINYTDQYIHSETNNPNSVAMIDSFNYDYTLNTKGSGFNLKLGTIYAPANFLRLGLAFHTKTYYNLKDSWTANMTTFRTDGTFTIPEEYIPTGKYKYRLRTPGKWIASAGFIFKNVGAINVDVEYLNYRGNRLKSTRDFSYDPEPNDYAYQNQEMKDLLRPVVNIRVGGEVVFATNYFVRLGFAHYPQPYKNELSGSYQATSVYSCGIGIRLKKVNFDLAYKLQNNNFDYIAYPESIAHFKNTANYFIGTFSVRF